MNRAANVKINEYDADFYCDFYLYWLEIYLPKKMRGHVDQLVILADVEGLAVENFKFAVTRRNVEEGLKYCPERQTKLYAVNVSNFSLFCWKFIKPLLPNKTHDKIVVTSNDIPERMAELTKFISPEVIPKHIGGDN